jgi:hypothetical protein
MGKAPRAKPRPVERDQVVRRIAAHWVDVGAREYARTKNPVHVWRAYAECRTAGLALPTWVVEYLDTIALTFARWSSAGQPVPRDLPVAIAKTLGMLRGRGEASVFGDFKDTMSLGLAAVVDQDMRNPRGPQKLYHSWEHVATTFGISVSKVRRAWHRHKDRFSAS